MSIRACIYKDCANFINLKDRSINKDVKLFSFPKNPERRQKWIELGVVPPNIPSSMYYFCSEHFDKKYFAINNIRTILVGEAVPYPYVEREIDDAFEEDASSNLDYYLFDLKKDTSDTEKQQLQDEQELQVESTTMPNEIQEDFRDEHYFINLDKEKSNECIIYKEENNTQRSSLSRNKRSLEESNTIPGNQSCSSKVKILKWNPLQKQHRKSFEKTDSEQTAAVNNSLIVSREMTDEIDADQLIDAQHVTTFIFKGEEYVQMSKNHYINEKFQLMQKLQKMECAIKAIKQHLNSLDFNVV